MTEQVTVVVRIKAKPGAEGVVREKLRGLLGPTRKEEGCINFDMHEAPDEPGLFLFHENWRRQADLDRHFETAHIKQWLADSESLLAEPMELTLWRPVA
jgi:quinol monooxygenase YgiN